MQGLLKDGGTTRKAAIEQLLTSVGGKLEVLYFGVGSDDIHMIVDLPDNVSLAAVLIQAGAAGVVDHFKINVLLTPEDIDHATRKTVSYRPPGQ